MYMADLFAALQQKRPLLMGIVNVTPDSFSDGGRFFSAEKAVQHALQLVQDGADIIDVGGESTRPGSERISWEEELRRVVPVIQAVRQKTKVCISVDTTKASVAAKALEAGANIVNDISSGTADPEMFALVKKYEAFLCLMHMRGTPQTMQQNTEYQDVTAEARDYLFCRSRAAIEAGVAREKIILDPGIGFAKSAEGNVKLLQELEKIVALGFPVLVGTSRKSFMGKLLGHELQDRLEGTLATLSYAWKKGAKIFRVHDVAAAKRYFEMVQLLETGRAHVNAPLHNT